MKIRKSAGRVWGLGIALFTVATALFTFSGCTVMSIMAFTYNKASTEELVTEASLGADPIPLSVDDPQVTIAWTPPPSGADSYTLLMRTHGTEDWYVLIEDLVAIAEPEHTVFHSDPAMGNGDFDFGVFAVQGTDISPMHISLDVTAEPSSGWYLSWDY
jgi:hypothetical protein